MWGSKYGALGFVTGFRVNPTLEFKVLGASSQQEWNSKQTHSGWIQSCAT